MSAIKTFIGKIIYGAIFLFFLPCFLWIWGSMTENIVTLSAVQSSFWGIGLVAIGLGLLVWAMIVLMKHGKGLPMNAYPPPKLVKSGPYSFLDHPIYTGFVALLVGFSLYAGSSSGLWMVTPVTALCIAALVLGYEKIDLKKRFPEYRSVSFTLLSGTYDKKVSWGHRLLALILPFTVWFVSNKLLFSLVGWNLVSDLGGVTYLSFAAWFLMAICFLLVAVFPFLFVSARECREGIISLLIVLGLTFIVSITFPIAGIYCFYSNFDSGLVFLTVHPGLIFLFTQLYSRAFSRVKFLLRGVGVVFSVLLSIKTASPALSFISGVFIFWVVDQRRFLWLKLCALSEYVANSWSEWTFGSLRIINHGLYVGFGAFVGVLMAGWLAGKQIVWAIVIFSIIGLVFSALWAQIIEGSEKLKRPFGYYGSLVGMIFGIPVLWLLDYPVWLVIGVLSVFMPWVQAIGRLRCLINGCCHGSPVENESHGIRYYHPRSRVCGLSELKGVALHPTPLYSILWLFIVGLFLLALWLNGATYSIIAGMYLILTGVGRFVEEAYRGEVQTKILYGLRLYQWTAIATVFIGILVTCLPVPRAPVHVVYDLSILSAALLLGLITFLAMGVDFPKSNKRFSRLV